MLGMLTLAAVVASHAAPTFGKPTKRWPASTRQIELELIDASPRENRPLAASAAQWNAVGAAPDLRVVEAPASVNVVARDGHNRVGIYRGEWAWPSGVGAVTIAWPNEAGDEIDEVDVALNPNVDWSVYDMQNALTHELGHALGLPDVKDPREATMFFLILPEETFKRDLTKADEDMLLELYEGIDETEGCSAAGVSSEAAIALALLAAFRRKK